MSGGITQLVAVGVQDAYLSGNPEVSFFRSSYKRYTHFAQCVERQLIQGTPTQNGVSLIRFEKKGDLLSDVYLTANDPNNTANVNVNWSQIISKMELMIGGQIIDTQDVTYCSNIDSVVNAKSYSQRYVAANVNSSVFFPLKFFFCRDWQSVLPLVALQYHDVEIRITWAQPNAWDQYIAWARFLYLDSAEREWFAKNKHDMLITQVTRVPISPVSTYEFALAQPIKYIAFESNNYNTVYNSYATSTSVILPFTNSINGVPVGMVSNVVGYISNAYVTSPFSANDSLQFSYTSQVVPSPIPINTIVNFSQPTFTATCTWSGSVATLTAVTPVTPVTLAQLNSAIAISTSATAGGVSIPGWTALVYGTASGITSLLGQGIVYNYNAGAGTFNVSFNGGSATGTGVAVTVSLIPPNGYVGSIQSSQFTTGSASTTATLTMNSNVIMNSTMVGYSILVPYGAGSNNIGLLNATISSVEVYGPDEGVATAGTTVVGISFPSTTITTAPTGSATATSATYISFFNPNLTTTAATNVVPLSSGSATAANMQFKMQINGNDIGESRSLPHWVDVNQYYLTSYGYYSLTAGSGLNGVIPVAIIPFCLDTAKLQPTGSLNFSRIDTFRLICPSQTNFQQLSKLGNGSYFYAVNYNVLRIQNGMGAVMYSS